jgi:hypothetical protein
LIAFGVERRSDSYSAAFVALRIAAVDAVS